MTGVEATVMEHLTVPAVAIGTLAELEKADLGGQIGILYGNLTQNGLSARKRMLDNLLEIISCE